MATKEIEKEVKWLVKNWKKIPAAFKVDLRPSEYSVPPGPEMEDGELVVLLIDRQKPSVMADYSFNEERIAVTRTGRIIWGFDSGCSCPSRWNDSYPTCYETSKEWKQFVVNIAQFDSDAIVECLATIARIKAAI